ncbi:MAG: hypothetical protein QGI93_06475 [Planctomycetota bacterium]|nr:hypothetical protein [Planctomycetota bacterium]MDP6939270.1 hypothetical protein [Planctomycetota bacterium]
MTRTGLGWMVIFSVSAVASAQGQLQPIDVGSQRQVFVDRHLIGSMDGVRLELGQPRDEGAVFHFDRSWEGPFCGYSTVIADGDRYLLYYRGLPEAGADGTNRETTCVAISTDGIRWSRPDLGLFEVDGTLRNNVILSDVAPVTHNFSPFLDGREGVDPAERFKALGGNEHSGLVAWTSPDGLRWNRLQEEPVITDGMFDSQNVAFWSEAEQCYACYLRTWSGGGYSGFRTVSRATSEDFIHWTESAPMGFGDGPLEHLYTNQTHPYFRAPQVYVGVAARFMPGRQVISGAEAARLGVNPRYFNDCSDAVLLTSRGGEVYERTFAEALIRPGIGLENWVSRSNYPALNIVQTSHTEMSLYVNQNYAQPTAQLHRYSMRLDGLASMAAGARGGEWRTKPMVFSGDRLVVNFATSARGGIRVEIQDASGTPLQGFTLEDAVEQIGNEIERTVAWAQGTDVSSLDGRPIRLRFAMTDADLFAFQFAREVQADVGRQDTSADKVDPEGLEVLSVERIWNSAPHSAFTDLMALDGRLYCTFREGEGHVFGANGRIRVIARDHGSNGPWQSVALLEEEGVDLRDPKLCLAPDGRIQVTFGGSVYEGHTLMSRRTRVAFLDSMGQEFGPSRKVMIDEAIRSDNDWLWRVTWHKGVGYGVVYQPAEDEWQTHLVTTRDGVRYEYLTTLEVSGRANETTLRFGADDRLTAIVRREGDDRRAWFGSASPPYERWGFEPLPERLGGPDFIGLGEDAWLVGGRRYGADDQKTVLGTLSADGQWSDVAVLPSSGDTSYPGFARMGASILVSYYSSHEGRTSIYLATLGSK